MGDLTDRMNEKMDYSERRVAVPLYSTCAPSPFDEVARGTKSEKTDLLSVLQAQLAAAHAACKAYEDGGYADPGRAIDAVRDALGRRS